MTDCHNYGTLARQKVTTSERPNDRITGRQKYINGETDKDGKTQ